MTHSKPSLSYPSSSLARRGYVIGSAEIVYDAFVHTKIPEVDGWVAA